MNTTTRKTYIGKERDEESYLGDFGVRKYDYAAGNRFTSPDVLWEKYMGWSPYSYSGNNPVCLLDPSGKNAAKIVNDANTTITIQAVYVYNPVLGGNLNDITEVNNELNSQNYTFTADGPYKEKGYSVKFDLTGVPSGVKDPDNIFTSNGINIGNTYQVNADFKWKDKEKGKMDFNEHNGIITGGVTLDNKNVAMNPDYNNKRNRTHEFFHTFFFNNDKGKSGIGNYIPGTDMPNKQDINNLVNSPLLREVK